VNDLVGTEAGAGEVHWATKPIAGSADGARLFLWRRSPPHGTTPRGVVLFVHGSSMASTPSFDLVIPGKPDSSVMQWFARRGFDTWCVDNEGYGRSSKHRDVIFDIACGADDLEAASAYILGQTGANSLLVYGSSSGALKAAVFAARQPAWVSRLALDAFVWTGAGSPTLEQRRRKLPEYQAGGNRRPIDRAFVRSIFDRDEPGTADEATIAAFADAILALDTSVPIGTYVDMCLNLPVVQPQAITCPTLIMRGQYDGIAGFDDLIDFFRLLPNPDKQFSVMPGIAHAAFKQMNYRTAFHILAGFFEAPPLVRPGTPMA
jgi:pimeloyl-ACP methyl ester carboxylesterase